jgi:hypothetical protein
MSATATQERVLTINPLNGSVREMERDIPIPDGFLLMDPREPLPDGFTGFEVLTARDGGRRVAWSRMNFDQIHEAKRLFDKLVSEGMVPYYIDPKTGQASGRVMDKFDPAEGAVMFENVVFAPTALARGG